MENVNIILARCKPSKCGSAGIGRQARLRILCQQWRVGSSPIFRSKTSSENLRSFFVRYYRENALSFIIGKKKKQKWQYNENALRICRKRTANLENVKKCFQGKREKESKSEQNHKMLLIQRYKRAAKQKKGGKCFKIGSYASSKTR